jgi:hypothetical protein
LSSSCVGLLPGTTYSTPSRTFPGRGGQLRLRRVLRRVPSSGEGELC